MRIGPQRTAANREQQGDDQELRATDPLRAALAVVPRQHRDDEKPDRHRQDDQVLDQARQPEALRHHVQHLDQCEAGGDVSRQPLHQLALLQPLPEPVHASPRLSDPAMMRANRRNV
ncbi:MAG: hypothetical protein JSR56_08705 [Proteobacteria bacterium]|nr:hypothetical protein [Pseudomonadota bacterium]